MGNFKKEDIIVAAEKSGFNLEFKTIKILQDNKYAASLSKILKVDGNRLEEIDVVGTKKVALPLHIIIECKGADSNTVLVLVKAHGSTKADDKEKIGLYSRYLLEKNRLAIFEFDHEAINYTQTGDFFIDKGQGKGLLKASKNDDQNNFYKSQLQILGAIPAYNAFLSNSDEFSSTHNIIVPLIITNADIWVVDLSQEKTDALQVDVAVQRVVNQDSKLDLILKEGKKNDFITVPIININYLEKFLQSLELNADNHTCYERIILR